MRTGFMWTIMVAAVAIGGVMAGSEARAQPRFGERLTLAGYRVMVEPEIVEDFDGRLVTRALHWRLRAVYRTSRGDEVLVRPQDGRRRRGVVADSVVRVNRPWEPTDHPRTSRLFDSFRKAKRRFERVRREVDVMVLRDRVVQRGRERVVEPDRVVDRDREVRVEAPGVRVHVDGDRGRAYVDETEPPGGRYGGPATATATCEQVLLEMGHAPSLLDECRGVEQRCAVTLLRKGHHPNLLDNCRGAEPVCAIQVLEAGHHPNLLDNCTPDLSPGCVTALLAAGHHPNLLDNCRGVDEVCAEALLRQGRHPNELDNCRRR